jgi:hypothetical protein
MRLYGLWLLYFTIIGGSHFSERPTSEISWLLGISHERRGCCSHHGCGCRCEKTRALCCDGKLSRPVDVINEAKGGRMTILRSLGQWR